MIFCIIFNYHHIFLNHKNQGKQVFLFSDGNKPESLSPLRNKLKNITPIPSRPTIDNFARPITQMNDDKKKNTIAITPKRPVPKIEETNLSEQLQSIFPDADQTIKQELETFKEKIDDLDNIIEKVSNIDDEQDEQKIFEFELLLAVLIKNLILLFVVKVFRQKIKNLLTFYNGICVKKY